MILGEYSPVLIYTKGSTNIVADARSRLNTEPTNGFVAEANEANAILCGVKKHTDSVTDFASTTSPLTFARIRNAQRSDSALLKLLQSNAAYLLKIFRGGRKCCRLIVHNDSKNPSMTSHGVVSLVPVHPGETRTENTIRLHY